MLHRCLVTYRRRIRLWHSFSYQIREKVKFISNQVKFQTVYKKYLSCPVLPQYLKKKTFIFAYDNWKCQKLCFKKDVITFTCFSIALSFYLFFHCTTKTKHIALNICMHVVCMYLYSRYSVFGQLQNFGFNSHFFLLIEVLSFVDRIENK